MKTVISASGYELYQDGPRYVLADRGTRGLSVVLFVFGIATPILFVPIGFTGALALQGEPGVWTAVGILTGLWLPVLGILLAAAYSWRRCQAVPADRLPIVLVVDHARGEVLDGSEQTVALIEQCRVGTRLRFASSSPTVVIDHPGGRHAVADGHPFLGGAGPLVDGLTYALSHRPS